MDRTPEPIHVPILRSPIDDLPPEELKRVEEELRKVAEEAAKRSHYTVEGEGALL